MTRDFLLLFDLVFCYFLCTYVLGFHATYNWMIILAYSLAPSLSLTKSSAINCESRTTILPRIDEHKISHRLQKINCTISSPSSLLNNTKRSSKHRLYIDLVTWMASQVPWRSLIGLRKYSKCLLMHKKGIRNRNVNSLAIARDFFGTDGLVRFKVDQREI